MELGSTNQTANVGIAKEVLIQKKSVKYLLLNIKEGQQPDD